MLIKKTKKKKKKKKKKNQRIILLKKNKINFRFFCESSVSQESLFSKCLLRILYRHGSRFPYHPYCTKMNIMTFAPLSEDEVQLASYITIVVEGTLFHGKAYYVQGLFWYAYRINGITITRLFKYIEISPQQTESFQIKCLIFFAVLTSTHNLFCWAEIRKITYTPVNSSFTI